VNQLWAPWRVEFIEGSKGPKPAGCIFCDFPAQQGAEADRKNLILGRSRHSFAILNKFPYNNGHLMVVPRRHTADFAGLPKDEATDLTELLQLALKALTQVYRPEGHNLGMNLGQVAGAGIADHLHWHAVPRWNGDTNFMPVIGETKVMIEHLTASYDRLRAAFEAALRSAGTF
jgi:ATP adenylyltransferase